MNINEIQAKSIITKSNLPESDFVINPYTGCEHACIYCYARFMKKFSGHMDEEWGEFVDVKVNAPDLVPQNIEKYNEKNIVIGSVTDPYQRVEEQYQITRKVLEKLVHCKASFDIITKSDLVTRDIDLLKQFHDMTVAISMCMADDEVGKKIDPNAPLVSKRIETLKLLHKNKIRTVAFISPMFPLISDWKQIVYKTQEHAQEYWFENLNLYPSVKNNVCNFVRTNYPQVFPKWEAVYADERLFWDMTEKAIVNFCTQNEINYRIFFHHKDHKKK